MTWTIATGGFVLMLDTEVEIGRFEVVTFEVEPRPTLVDFDALRERLVGTAGHFQIDGEAPSALAAAYDGGKGLLLRFESHGARVEVGVQRQTERAGAVFPFAVVGPVYIQALAPE